MGAEPLPAPFLTARPTFTSVTAHGVSMAYVLTTFVVMGFGYYVAETALERPLRTQLGLGRLLARRPRVRDGGAIAMAGRKRPCSTPSIRR